MIDSNKAYNITYREWKIQAWRIYTGSDISIRWWKQGVVVDPPENLKDKVEAGILLFFEIGNKYAGLTIQDVVDKYLNG